MEEMQISIVNIGDFSEPSSSYVPPINDDADILFGDEQEPLEDFVFHPFSLNVTSNDEDAPIT